ncbi:unnamed protein product, partial [Choristocarpus tenellus]
FDLLGEEERNRAVEAAVGLSKPRSRPKKASTLPCKLVLYLADQVIHGERSSYKGLAPPGMTKVAPVIPEVTAPAVPAQTAKSLLDAEGPEAMAAWVRKSKRVLVTDTTMRDAHQSLLATRVRTVDLVEGAKLASKLLGEAFSLEV